MPHFAFHSSVCCGLHSIFLSQTQHGPTSFIWSHSCQISNAIFLAKSHNQYRVLSVFSDVFDIISYAYHLACEVSTSILLFLIISRAFLLIVSSHWLLLNKTHSFFFPHSPLLLCFISDRHMQNQLPFLHSWPTDKGFLQISLLFY